MVQIKDVKHVHHYIFMFHLFMYNGNCVFVIIWNVILNDENLPIINKKQSTQQRKGNISTSRSKTLWVVAMLLELDGALGVEIEPTH